MHRASANLPSKFHDPHRTAKGEARAWVAPDRLRTLWVNTGSLCNIACTGCYIESSPRNERLAYITPADLVPFLDELAADHPTAREVGFTGGEPFMNPYIVDLLAVALERGLEALVLTNGMKPLHHCREGLLSLRARYPQSRLTLRVSLDHHTPEGHERLRGPRSWAAAVEGLRWAAAEGFAVAVAGRSVFGETPAEARAGYARLFAAEGLAINAFDPWALVLFPEMLPEASEAAQVPEITTACWDILHKRPQDVMCASTRMVVRRAGAPAPTVLACTLIAYDARFDLGATLAAAWRPVSLNHPHCATFCVLGGAACSA